MRDSACAEVVGGPAGASTMDEREMTTGVIPLRHASLPGHVKLPRRYEKAAMGTNGIPTRVRKISIQPGHSPLGDSLSDRMSDLMAAVMWVKQELIMLRQHDILLKRQFFNIQDSIQSLQRSKPSPTILSKPTDNATTTTTTNNNNHNNTTTNSNNNNHNSSSGLHNGDVLPAETEHDANDRRLEEAATAGRTNSNGYSHGHSSSNNINGIGVSNDFPLDTYVVRPSSSVTLLHEESEEEEDADLFAEEFFFRPRTSSMRTSRDMAALARRRGSKELI